MWEKLPLSTTKLTFSHKVLQTTLQTDPLQTLKRLRLENRPMELNLIIFIICIDGVVTHAVLCNRARELLG